MEKRKKIICDIDGILCSNLRVPYLKKKPYNKNITRLNILYNKGHKIILFTSRKSRYRKLTLRWLKKHNVKFNKLIMDKPKGNIYIDDKSLNNIPLKMGG